MMVFAMFFAFFAIFAVKQRCVLCVSKAGADLKNPGQTARVSFVLSVRPSVGADLQVRDIADGRFQRIVKGVLGPDPQWGEEIPENLANFAP